MRNVILVTGGGGFLGTYIVGGLRRKGYTVSAPRKSVVDLTDRRQVDELFAQVRPGAVIHAAAAAGGIGANAREPGRFFHDNAAMALHLLEASRRHGVARFVGVGTTCSYPREAPLPLSEADIWAGEPDSANAPYGHAKRFMLAQMDAYRRQYGLSSVLVIPANLYGPGDHFALETSHVVPGMLRRFEEARAAGAAAVTLWGDGSPTRDFLHVRDAAAGIIAAYEEAGLEGVVNVGSGEETSMRSLAALVAAAVGFTGETHWDASRPNGQPRRCLATRRARETLGFAATIGLAAGIAETLAWYRETAAAARAA
jgi:GDP-L-fucose synthase